MAVCEPESQGLTAAEAFAEAVVKRASAALSKRATRRDVFYIGSIPFELVTPGERADEWLGRAFLQCDEVANRCRYSTTSIGGLGRD